MVVNSDFRYDSRVQKEALALSQAGHDVTVFSLAMTVPQDQSFPGIRVLNPTTEKMAWFPYKPSYLKACRQVLCALLREKGDIWHGHDLVSGRPRQFIVMCEKRRCSILFHLLVPGGR